MSRVDIINNLIDALKLNPGNLELINSTDASCEYEYTFNKGEIPNLPTELKSVIRDTSYSDDMVDSNNDTIMFTFNREPIGDDIVNCSVIFEYVSYDKYSIKFLESSKVDYDDSGNEYFI